MDGFDAVIESDAERDALTRLRAATGATAGPMERHCLRCRRIAAELARRHGWVIDGEVLTAAAILHDIGLHRSVATGGVYTRDGADLAHQLLPRHGWSTERIERCAAAIDRHHEQPGQLAREVGRALRERPMTLPRIFLRS